MARYYNISWLSLCLSICRTSICPYFRFWTITWVNINGFSSNLVCTLLLLRSGLGLPMGKFHQFLTVTCLRHNNGGGIFVSHFHQDKHGKKLMYSDILGNYGTFCLSGFHTAMRPSLLLSMLGKNISWQHFEVFFLFFHENRLWHFMHIVSKGDNLLEMPNLICWSMQEIYHQFVLLLLF